jgi:hypothetical protein
LVQDASRAWSSPCGTHGGRRRMHGSRAGKKGGFYSRLKAVGRSLRAKTVGSGYGRWHGKYGDVWAVACVGLRANGGEAVRRPAVERDTRGTSLLPRPRHPYLATMSKTPRTDRRSEAGLGVRAPGHRAARLNFVWLCLNQFFSKFLN